MNAINEARSKTTLRNPIHTCASLQLNISFINFRWHHGWHKFWRITLSIVEIWQQNFSQDWFFNEEQKGEYLHGEQTRITVTRIYYNIWINQRLYNYLYEYVIQFYVDSFPLFDLRECIMRLSISNLVHKCFHLLNIKNRNIYWIPLCFVV